MSFDQKYYVNKNNDNVCNFQSIKLTNLITTKTDKINVSLLNKQNYKCELHTYFCQCQSETEVFLLLISQLKLGEAGRSN
jgi:hypothetical protein